LVPRELRKYVEPSNRSNFFSELYKQQEAQKIKASANGSAKIIQIRKAENPILELPQDVVEAKPELTSIVKPEILELPAATNSAVKKFLSSFYKDGILSCPEFETTSENLKALYYVYCIFGRNLKMQGMPESSVRVYSSFIKKATDLEGDINDITKMIKIGLNPKERQNVLNLLTPSCIKLFEKRYPLEELPIEIIETLTTESTAKIEASSPLREFLQTQIDNAETEKTQAELDIRQLRANEQTLKSELARIQSQIKTFEVSQAELEFQKAEQDAVEASKKAQELKQKLYQLKNS
jgi:hypothetical protein